MARIFFRRAYLTSRSASARSCNALMVMQVFWISNHSPS
jgi:hypothetical protein